MHLYKYVEKKFTVGHSQEKIIKKNIVESLKIYFTKYCGGSQGSTFWNAPGHFINSLSALEQILNFSMFLGLRNIPRSFLKALYVLASPEVYTSKMETDSAGAYIVNLIYHNRNLQLFTKISRRHQPINLQMSRLFMPSLDFLVPLT